MNQRNQGFVYNPCQPGCYYPPRPICPPAPCWPPYNPCPPYFPPVCYPFPRPVLR